MKVHFLQSGGYAGLVRGCVFDTAELSPEQSSEIEKLVRESGLSGSGKFFSETQRDLQQYEITIEEGSCHASITFDDASIPSTAKSLIHFLKKNARPRQLK